MSTENKITINTGKTKKEGGKNKGKNRYKGGKKDGTKKIVKKFEKAVRIIANERANQVGARLIRKHAGRLRANIQHNYLAALLTPEISRGIRVPYTYANNCCTMWRHITYPLLTNGSGLAFIAFNPYCLLDNTVAATKTSFGINNDDLYDGSTTFGAGTLGKSINYNVTPNTVNNFRLVSASMWVIPQNSFFSQQGKISGAVVPWLVNTVNVGSILLSPAANSLQVISGLQNSSNYAEAQVSLGQCLRLVWFPKDPKDYVFNSIDGAENVGLASWEDAILCAAISGSGIGASFNVEIYLNYEVTAYPNSTLVGMDAITTSQEDPEKAVLYFKMHPEKIAMPLALGGFVGQGPIQPPRYNVDIGGKQYATGMKQGRYGGFLEDEMLAEEDFYSCGKK